MFILYTSSVLFYNNNFIEHCYNFWIQQYLHTWTYWFVYISDKSISTQQIRWLYIFCCICIQILLNRCFLSIKYLPQIPTTSLLPLELCVAKIDTKYDYFKLTVHSIICVNFECRRNGTFLITAKSYFYAFNHNAQINHLSTCLISQFNKNWALSLSVTSQLFKM